MNDPVKQKIIELVPEIADRPDSFSVVARKAYPEITLADVLRAIEEHRNAQPDDDKEWWSIDTRGEFLQLSNVLGSFPAVWNLIHDYDNQTQATRSFIGKLLGIADGHSPEEFIETI